MGSRYRGLRVLVIARHLCTTRQAKQQDYREAELFLRGALNTKQERDHAVQFCRDADWEVE